MNLTKLLTTAAVLAALASPAYASGLLGDQHQNQAQAQQQHQGQGQSQNNYSKNHNSNKNTNISGAAAGAAAINKGNAFSSSTSVDASTDIDAEPAYAPNVNLTSTGCIGSIGGSAGGLGLFSFGFAKTTEVVNCFKIEVWKGLIGQGRHAEAEKLLRSIDWYAEAIQQKEAALTPPMKLAVKTSQTTGAQGQPGDRGDKWEIPLECTLGLVDCEGAN